MKVNLTDQGNNYYCSCVTPSSYGAPVSCGPQAFFVSFMFPPFGSRLTRKGYYHTPAAAASGLTKRKQREAAAAIAAAKLNFCPKSWTACNIGGSDDEYEVRLLCISPGHIVNQQCIDVSKELESCGGCMEGQFYAPNATAGLE